MNGMTEFDESELPLIGEGSRRRCYRVPDKTLCVKFYRLPDEFDEKTRMSVKLSVWLARHVPRLNVNCHEWRYHRALRKRLPADLFAVFPEFIQPVYSGKRGWGVLESLLESADGNPVQKIDLAIRRAPSPAMRDRLYAETERLFERLAEHAVCFFDPQNVLVQWQSAEAFRLRIADFDPQDRAFVPGLSYIRPYVRCKVRRRCKRFLARMREVYFQPR